MLFGRKKRDDEDEDDIAFDDEENVSTNTNTNIQAPHPQRNVEDTWYDAANEARKTNDGLLAQTQADRQPEHDDSHDVQEPPASMQSQPQPDPETEDDGFAPASDEPASQPEQKTGTSTETQGVGPQQAVDKTADDGKPAADEGHAGAGNTHQAYDTVDYCPYVLVKADDAAFIPKPMNPGDAGFDLAITQDVTIPGGGRATVGTGIALAIPRGYAGLVLSRSGLAAKRGIAVLNAPGLIDSGYRDEVKVILINTGNEPQTLNKGNRIAQLIIQKVEDPPLYRTNELPQSERGLNGLGSTGV